MNYAQLVSAIEAYSENYETSFVANIPVFVQNAEERIYNTVQLPALRKNATSNLTIGNKYLTVPEDYLAVFSLAVVDLNGNYQYLLDKDVNFIRASYPNPNTMTGVPQYYALFDRDSFIFGPSPDAAYQVELHYFYYPESIVTAGTSWLGDNFESVLLYGALLEGATYMKEDVEVLSNYMARYNEALALLKQLGDGKNRQDAYRNGQVRDAVR
jgi:hypothetical protein